MRTVITKLFGDPAEKQLKQLQTQVEAINELESQYEELSDAELTQQTASLRSRLHNGEELEAVLPAAFATVREAARRVLGMRHFDVQVLGGLTLHAGNVAEMKTGEGKTLAATLPVYTNALTERGVHVVTVNDYLARRDAGWMGQVYHFLGMSVGVITSGNQSLIYDPDVTNEEHSDERLRHFRSASKQDVYACDIVYGTNNEFGFDYLRDNMARSKDRIVQRDLVYAIVDEVDSILIDEARTPLIISAPAQKSADLYQQFSHIAKQLEPETDYTVDEKQKAVSLTDAGVNKVEQALGVDNLYDPEHVQSVFHLEQALKAESLFIKDKNYVVREGQVVIVDEFTGRLMPGRRFGEGIHQAIEAKEGVSVLQESMTLATISFQNYFRQYEKLAGMTGTAKTEEEELQNIYNLDVIPIPTHKPMIRQDLTDRIYKTEAGKFEALADDVSERHQAGQPVLIGTGSIERNERLAAILNQRKIPHELLNAKNNEKEAEIIARAGSKGAVTLATNIAGRGTDIVLGGDPDSFDSREQWQQAHEEVVALGGLHVLGGERHESRRIDNQLRGRAGRQGDPGSSQFYVSLEDDIMRIFGGDRISGLMGTLNVDEKTPIESGMIAKTLENAQKRVESHNYDSRKNVLQYDDVMDKHRQAIYSRRREILEEQPLKDDIIGMLERTIERHLVRFTPSADAEEAEGPDSEAAAQHFQQWLPSITSSELEQSNPEDWHTVLMATVEAEYEDREERFGEESMRFLERQVYLSALDQLWMDHLESMSHLRQSIQWRSLAQRQPIVEYKREAREMFDQLLVDIEEEVATHIFRLAPKQQTEEEESETELTKAAEHATASSGGQQTAQANRTVRKSEAEKVGRNDPCPCGSGLKYKKCGLIDAPQHQG